MKETVAQRLITEWRNLHAERHQLDHAIAKLCHEIHAECASDADAIEFIIERIGATSRDARRGLNMARAWDAVRNADHWKAIGGERSAAILADLPKKQRMTVLAEVLASADAAGRPASTVKVRNIAWSHGFIDKPAERRGDTTQRQLITMVSWCRRMLVTGAIDLKMLPNDVREIVAPSKTDSKVRRAA